MRFNFLACFLFLAIGGALAQDVSLKDVVKAFEDADIPKILAINFKPKLLLEVTFPQESETAVTLKAGVQLARNATKGPPTFAIRGVRTPGPFVIAMVDPDAPTPQDPWAAQIRHYLGGNHTVHDRGGALKNQTSAITEYLQPGPPAGSDAHRYIFLLFKQPKDFAAQEVITPSTSVVAFNISGFAETVGLGEPLAGTFMRVAPDPPAV
ncbi:hypothetical protein D9611_007356 [Ephemerocybe angulata]|uniref:Phosphatidylethanolamine-binding protein n=1 Tax=Ephemerocybe angulata TaxID=980116 RepID=A0A8H5CFE5_9AGAR|nr:hypothetical protein D9611_007356 [Tulosesus angulatus]